MALDYNTLYPAQTDVAAAYPQGKARNVSAPGAGDGTPWIADLVNDLLFGPWQQMLRLTGTVPSGTPDNANTSQHMEALARWLWGTLVASNWTPVAQGSQHFNAVCYSPDLEYWIAVGENGSVLATNGWSSTLSAIGGSPDLNAVCWSESEQLFIACGDGGVMYTSPDGGTWTAQASNTTNDLMALAVKPGSPDTIVAVGLDGGSDDEIIFSNDGINWNNATYSAGYNRHSVCWSADLGIFVCGHASGNAETSADGITWTVAPTSGTVLMHDVAWSPRHQKFIGVGSAGEILGSDDGVAWTVLTTITGTPAFYAVAVDETLGQVLAFGQNGIWSSFDLTTWYKRLTSPNIDIRGASWSLAMGQTMAVGDDGLTLFSLRGIRP